MSATRCFSCIAFPFPRVVLGSKNIRASKAAPVKSQRSPARATNSGRATTPVPAASCWPFSASVLTSYIEGQCRLLLYCNTHFKNLAYRTLGDGLPLFTELPRRLIIGNPVFGISYSRKARFVLCSVLRTARSVGYTGLASQGGGLHLFNELPRADSSRNSVYRHPRR